MQRVRVALSKPRAPQGRAGRAQVPVEGLASPHLPAAPCRLPELGSAPQRMLSTGFRAESFHPAFPRAGFWQVRPDVSGREPAAVPARSHVCVCPAASPGRG